MHGMQAYGYHENQGQQASALMAIAGCSKIRRNFVAILDELSLLFGLITTMDGKGALASNSVWCRVMMKNKNGDRRKICPLHLCASRSSLGSRWYMTWSIMRWWRPTGQCMMWQKWRQQRKRKPKKRGHFWCGTFGSYAIQISYTLWILQHWSGKTYDCVHCSYPRHFYSKPIDQYKTIMPHRTATFNKNCCFWPCCA